MRMAVVRAAGGLLSARRVGRRDGKKGGGAGVRLAVIHRPHRKDWSLPKGKLDDGETWEACALREVREETGCEGRLATFAGAMSYVPRNNPKIVLYWHMELTREGKLEAKFATRSTKWPGSPRRRHSGVSTTRASGESSSGSPRVSRLRRRRLRRPSATRRSLWIWQRFGPTSSGESPCSGGTTTRSGLVPALDLVAAAEDAAAAGRSRGGPPAARWRAGACRCSRCRNRSGRSARACCSSKRRSWLPRAAGRYGSCSSERRFRRRPSTWPRRCATRRSRRRPRARAARPARPTRRVRPATSARPATPAPVARTTLPYKALGAVAGLAVLGLGVLLLLAGARGASVAGAVVTSALVGGAAGFLASRRR